MSTDTDRIQFLVQEEAWYFPTLDDDFPGIRIGRDAFVDGREDGCLWEFQINLTSIGHPQVQMFDDAWAAYADPEMAPFWAGLAELGSTPRRDRLSGVETLAAVRELAERCGFIDDTPRVSPYGVNPPKVER